MIRSITIIAHRGASGHAPEHTFASWDRALEMGADYIEQDLQMTRDGELVVIHDATLDRTTNGRGPVSDYTLAEIQQFDAGSWFDPRFAGERVRSLREVFARYGDGVNYYIETKTPESAPGMEEKLLALMDEFHLRAGAVSEWQVLIQSFSAASLRLVRAMNPGLPLIQLIERKHSSKSIRRQLAEIKEYAVGIGPARTSVDEELVDAAHALGLIIHPYTVNETSEMQRLIDIGVDGMFTDYPDRLAQLIS